MDKIAWMREGSRWKLIFVSSLIAAAVLASISVDSRRQGSISSRTRNQASIAQEGLEVARLDITSVIQHGDIYEIQGSAEPGSSVMINGQYAPMFFDNSTFKYFVGPLPYGVTVLTITAQNEYGGFNTKQVALTIP